MPKTEVMLQTQDTLNLPFPPEPERHIVQDTERLPEQEAICTQDVLQDPPEERQMGVDMDHQHGEDLLGVADTAEGPQLPRLEALVAILEGMEAIKGV